MTIDDFCSRFGGDVRNIDAVATQWNANAIDQMLCKLDDEVIGSALILGDVLHGD